MTGGDAAITTKVPAAGHVKWYKKHLESGPHTVSLLSRVKATKAILCFSLSHSLFYKYTPHLVNLLPPVSTLAIFHFSFNVCQISSPIHHFAFSFFKTSWSWGGKKIGRSDERTSSCTIFK